MKVVRKTSLVRSGRGRKKSQGKERKKRFESRDECYGIRSKPKPRERTTTSRRRENNKRRKSRDHSQRTNVCKKRLIPYRRNVRGARGAQTGRASVVREANREVCGEIGRALQCGAYKTAEEGPVSSIKGGKTRSHSLVRREGPII